MNYPPPASNWPDGNHRQKTASWVAPMIVGAAIFAVGCGSGLLAGWAAGAANTWAGAFASSMLEPIDATIAVQAPDTVPPGQPFDITVTITDTRGEPRTLRWIDWEGSMTTRLTPIAVTPPPGDVSTDFELREHEYDLSIPANGSVTVTFTVQSPEPGPLELFFNVYLDDFNSESAFHTMTVE